MFEPLPQPFALCPCGAPLPPRAKRWCRRSCPARYRARADREGRTPKEVYLARVRRTTRRTRTDRGDVLAQRDRRKRNELAEVLSNEWVEIKKGEWLPGRFADFEGALDYAMSLWMSKAHIPEGRMQRIGGLSNKEIVKEVRKRYKVVVDDPHQQ